MKQIQLDYHVKVQCHSTNKSRKKQHSQNYLALPVKLCKLWDLETGRIVRLILNGNGDVVMTKADSKPDRGRLTYPEWLRRITPFIPIEGPGKASEEICREAGITQRSRPAIWVNWAKDDIGLNNDNKDPKTHQILWYRMNIKIDGKDQKQKETKLREPTLREFQTN